MGWLSLWGDRARRRDPIGPFLWDHTSCVQGTTQAVSKGPPVVLGPKPWSHVGPTF